MKTYSIISPSLEGILLDDNLYFEGAHRPSSFFTMRDGVIIKEEDILVMEKYFNDIHNLFLKKFADFSNGSHIENKRRSKGEDEESVKLQALLQELIKVKELIENSSKVVIMRG